MRSTGACLACSGKPRTSSRGRPRSTLARSSCQVCVSALRKVYSCVRRIHLCKNNERKGPGIYSQQNEHSRATYRNTPLPFYTV